MHSGRRLNSASGSKIKANASNRKVLTGKELEFLLRFVNDELEEWARQTSLTDSNSHFIKNGKGKIDLSYDTHITVDNRAFILSSDVCQDATDMKQLEPQVLQVEKNVGPLPAGVVWSFDAGYFGGANIKFLSDKMVDEYIPENKNGGVVPHEKSRFRYDMERDEYLCPEKKRSKFIGEYFDK